LFIITADHRCDPETKSTDHSRENVPVIVYQKNKQTKNLGIIDGFDYVGESVEKFLEEGEL
jgi:phosphopentomutase